MAAPTPPITGVAMPEWLNRRDRENGAWQVRNGPAQRGEAWTALHERIMRVPFAGDETNRVIRAHEMMHARVSPETRLGIELGISDDALQAAEEFRVNTLVSAAEFDLNVLVDGSERLTGQRLAQMEDYRNLVFMTAATAGGKACKDMLRGVRNVNPGLAKNLRELEKSLLGMWKRRVRDYGAERAAQSWGSTKPVSNDHPTMGGYPRGYAKYTIPIARSLDDLAKMLDETKGEAEGEADTEDGEQQPMDGKLVKDLVAATPGEWANLVFRETRVNRKAKGNLGRKRIAANTGINPRRMNRMLTDPQRRVFDRKRRINGGIVIIDQSGSMALSTDDIERLMEASPGCTIVGYSNMPGYRDQDNAWVLARDGRRVETLPSGHGGNGVDGPIVRWAVEQVKRSEPIVWVCDGVVTSYHDTVHLNLTLECAQLVRRHSIHMTPTVTDAIAALSQLEKGRRLPTTYTGEVHKAARRLGFTV